MDLRAFDYVRVLPRDQNFLCTVTAVNENAVLQDGKGKTVRKRFQKLPRRGGGGSTFS